MEYENMRLETLEGVYEPREDSFLAAAEIKKAVSKIRADKISILDIGTGSGILGLVASSNRKVVSATFADINPKAIRLARRNYLKNKKKIFAKCHFIKSDLFSKIKSRYDLILFNTPYLPEDKDYGPSKKMISRAWEGGKEGIEITVRFLDEAKTHLKKGGKIIIVVSSLGNLRKLRRVIRQMKLHSRVVAKIHVFFEDIIVLNVGVG